jgi:hypothetical protein
MTEMRKQLCGWKLCNTITYFQKTLNAFFSRTLKQLTQSVSQAVLPRQRISSHLRASQDYRCSVANPNMSLKHLKPGDVLIVMTCQNVADLNSLHGSVFWGVVWSVQSTKSQGTKMTCQTMPQGSTLWHMYIRVGVPSMGPVVLEFMSVIIAQ